MLEISTDPARLDVDTVHRWLSTDAYWALGRPREVVETSIANSLCFGAYDDEVLVGFARLVTDRSTFAWLCDVYVAPEHRAQGIGTALMDAIDKELVGRHIKRALLVTTSSPGLYARYGYAPISDDSTWMGRTYQGG
ncbi:GNAT family N-acetyltransferase [Nocardioides dongkuii]|uniref:GNAT family N-acetyltransferase n=1 Tax=Nocardioides dongkuii TaxID=2760089 RepID=UPI0015FA65BA|nr:GNAT family N-acetyltransferase [Nocardioides dongkuii]